MGLPASVTLTEVALRDGLQDEPSALPTAGKLRVFDGLVGAGVRSVELGAFVRKDRVPQMADTDEMFALVGTRPGVTCSGLVMNVPGAKRALAANAAEVRLVVSASDGHSRANAGRSGAEALDELVDAAGVLVSSPRPPAIAAGIATAFVCPYDGPTPPHRLVGIARRLLHAGAQRLSLADTLGAATPVQVRAGIMALRDAFPDLELGLHLHDTCGMALACAWEALQLGVGWFDAALGGIGGCPFAPGAAGNVASEDLLGLLHGVGIRTGVDLDGMLDLVPLLGELVGHDLGSHRWHARNARRRAHRSVP